MDRPDELAGASASSPESEHSRHPEQEHPEQDAHGGSMAPGLVDDTGQPVADLPDSSS
ncbi:MAG TPA: GTPase activator [Actinoplanes sp.]|jgi:hypothetical protein